MHAHAKLLALLFLFAAIQFAEDAAPSESDFSNVEAASSEIDAQISAMLEASGVTSGTCAPDSDLFSLLGPAVLALLLVSSGIAMFYMVGKFLDAPPLIAIARNEMLEALNTALITVLFFAFLLFAGNTVLGSPYGAFDSAMDYSAIMIHKISKDMFWLSALNTLLHMLYAAPLRIGVLYHAIRFNLGGLLKPFVDGVGTMASLLSFALGEWIANINVLCFIKKFVPTILLPIGIIFRSLPQTRGGGNALIALSVALFVVYPLMIYMNYEAYKSYFGTVESRSNIQEITTSFSLTSGMGALLVGFIWLRSVTGMLLGVPFLMGILATVIDVYADVLYTVFVLSIFLPLLNIFVTLTVARELAKYFGTEINISAFVKLI
ncbi:MAG: hypothetical protein QXH30_03760 [Candidatus Bilamarchaeaceae archaeon]